MKVTLKKGAFGLLVIALLSAAVTGCSKDARKARHLSRANSAFAGGHYDKAEIEYLKVREYEPGNLAAIRQLGFIYQEEGRWYPAYAYLSRAATLEPANAQVHARLAVVMLSLQGIKQAREEALKALSLKPGIEEALLVLVDTSVTPAVIQDSLQRIGQMRRADKDRAEYHVALGLLHLRQGDLAGADSELSAALALDPKSAAAHAAMGSLYWQRHDLAQADKAFKTAADLSPWRSGRRLSYAQFKLRNRDLEGGRTILTQITQKCPDYIPAWNFLAQLALAEKKYDECGQVLKKLLVRDPSNYEGLLLQGNLKLAMQEPAQAVAQFQRMLTLYTNSYQADLQLARAYRLSGDSASAAQRYNVLIKRMPDAGEPVLELADLDLKTSQPRAAISVLEDFLKRQPKSAPAQLLLARAHTDVQEYDQALAIYRSMSQVLPKNPQIPYWMGKVLFKQGNHQGARDAFTRALELKPDFEEAFDELVGIDVSETNYDAAIAKLNKRIQEYPSSARPPLLLGRLFKQQGKTQEAETAFEKALQLDPENQEANLSLAELYVASNNQQAALDKLNALLAKTNSLPALMQAGIIHESLKQYDAARDAYERILAANPSQGPALNNLACLYAEHLGDLAKAYDLAQRARQAMPDLPQTADTLGWILCKKGEFLRALPLLQDAHADEKLGANPEVEYHLGMAYYMAGQEDAARPLLEKAAAAKAVFSGKPEAQQCLDYLAIDSTSASASDLSKLENRVAQATNDIPALRRLGKIYERDGAFEKAAHAYESLLALSNSDPDIMFRLSKLYSGPLKQPQKAMALARDAHTLTSDDPEISATLAHLALQKGDYNWAHTLLQGVVKKLPKRPDVHLDLALAAYNIGRVSEAEEILAPVLRKGAAFDRLQEARDFSDMINAGKNSSSAEKAADKAEQLLKQDPTFIPALMVAGLAQEQQKDFQKAKTTFEKVLDLNPKFTPATRELALLYVDQHWDTSRAYDVAMKAQAAFPKDPLITRALGIMMFDRRDYSGAVKMLTETLVRGENDAFLQYCLGMAQYNLKHPKESKEALEKALALPNLDPKCADEARAALAKLK